MCAQHYLDNDLKLRKFVPIIQQSVVYPVILDANRTVLSLPPIINGAHSAVRGLLPYPVSSSIHLLCEICDSTGLPLQYTHLRTLIKRIFAGGRTAKELKHLLGQC